MIDFSKLFVFDSKIFGRIVVRAEENLCSSEVLKMYVDWYEKDFRPLEENLSGVPQNKMSVSDFVFVESFGFVDFYEGK